MQRTRVELVELIEAKQAYGVKTTRLENELAGLDRAALPVWRRSLNDIAGAVLIYGFAALFWGLPIIALYRSIEPFFKH